MMFRPELALLVMSGAKTVTRRVASNNPRSPWFVDRCGLTVGRRYAVNPGRGVTRIGTVEVVSIEKHMLAHLDDAAAQAEGFTTASAFEGTFAKLNGGRYEPATVVWRIGLAKPRYTPADGEIVVVNGPGPLTGATGRFRGVLDDGRVRIQRDEAPAFINTVESVSPWPKPERLS